ncbi:MAG: Flp family type IVb pilin [Candidatus Omnitrophica bacterium]|nr:Flp family type IVb pilin [Candidatus Omnitrophota bacterium]
MGFLRNKRAQAMIEYALVVAIVSAALVAMSTYVYRSVQSKQKDITAEYDKE